MRSCVLVIITAFHAEANASAFIFNKYSHQKSIVFHQATLFLCYKVDLIESKELTSTRWQYQYGIIGL
jgi:hypothetical protein